MFWLAGFYWHPRPIKASDAQQYGDETKEKERNYGHRTNFADDIQLIPPCAQSSLHAPPFWT